MEQSVSQPVQSALDRFQILSLDGGGIKGMFSAAVLANIEEDLQTRIIDHFDLIAGTSTGGIIAIALGLGLTARQILEFYSQEGCVIFNNRFKAGTARQLVRRKYSAAPLRAALKKHFGDKRFGDSLKRLIIPAYNLGEDDVYIFRTAHNERLMRDYKLPAWKVALSTSAAPTFFPCAREIEKMRLIDGGVWANNPSMVALVEAFGPLSVPLKAIRMLSLGTSNPIINRKKSLDRGGFFQWRTAGVDVVMRGQSLAAENQSRFFLGEDRFLRLNPVVPPDTLSLDGVADADDLVGKAAHHSRKLMPAMRAVFFDHLAPTFTPIYR